MNHTLEKCIDWLIDWETDLYIIYKKLVDILYNNKNNHLESSCRYNARVNQITRENINMIN